MSDKYFYKVAENVEDYGLFKLVPDEYQTHFVKAHGPVSFIHHPHTIENMVMLNLYTKDIPYKITFYKLKSSEPVKTYRILNWQMTCYSEEDVEEVDSFIAKSGDLWLVDLSKIHSFSSTDESLLQKAVQLKTTQFTLEEVYQMLVTTGAIRENYSFGY